MNMKICDSGQIFRPVLSSVSNFFADYNKGLMHYRANPIPTRKRSSLKVASQKSHSTNSPPDSDDTSEDKLPLSSKRLKIIENEDQMKMREVRSLIQAEFGSTLTAEEIKSHLSSLMSSSNRAPMECSGLEDRRMCQLCLSGELMFASSPMYCSNCSGRIKDKGNYYSSQQYCFCSRCVNFTRSRGDIMVGDVKVLKAKLEKKKNCDNKQVEAWVKCGRCERWQHQICGLYSGLESNEDYVCLKCVLKEMEFKEMKKPKSVGFCAKDLPSTKLSDHIETRLILRLKQERLERLSQVNNGDHDEVLVDCIVVREVLSVAKKVKVKQEYKELFPKESYPDEFPYRLKVILMFQKIDGVDVCIFGMYVQEFGAECSYPNKGCVYISYLDSVKYFRPEETRTVTGEALRTFVYHEILIGYIEFCKQRGFTTAYIWACPPSKEEDYILYCHPPTQRTPLPVKLRKWYQSMIKKATNAGIVVGCGNLYDKFFIPSSAGECHSNKVTTAASLPHFDGDFWSSCAEDLIKEMMSNKTTTIRKRTLEAMGHTNINATTSGSAKDVLLMQRLGEALLANRENFLVVDLQYVCIHCHEAIVSGEYWSCNRCKNFHLCEKCHKSFWGKEQQHELSKVIEMEDAHEVPDTTRNVEATLSNSLFEERPSFLNFCVKHHYQFDTLRHAKYSSLMILHQLRGLLPAPKISTEDDNDKQRSTAVSHVTKIAMKKKKAKGMMSPEVVKELLNVLKHSTLCYPTKNQPCSYHPNRNCFMIKKLFLHVKKCEIRVARGCELCSKAWRLLILHSKECRVSKCAVPRCMDLKEHHRKTRAESEVSSKPVSPSTSRWLPEVGISAQPHVMVPY